MKFNSNKSVAMRIGSKYNKCKPMQLSDKDIV